MAKGASLWAAFGAWLDRVPLVWLVVVAGWLAMAPFFPEPHLWEKLKMLVAGTLARPIDIFDLVMHGTPVMLLAWRLVRQVRRPKT